ncbi:MAG: HEAT repeat domain-containing protein [Promethearchaeota archaeon]|jgi:predicted  nucleic acid-binding Zn-ribbon protein
MSKDFKDLIDTIENETKTRAELEATINSLNEEINRLNSIINEQKMLLSNQTDSSILSTLPGEIDVLKELITSQRQELIEKDESNEKLNDQIDELKARIEKYKDGAIAVNENEDLIEAQELVLAFSEENEDLKNQIEELKIAVNSVNSGISEIDDQGHIGDSEEMVNIKRLNFQLMEENGLLRVEIESLKVQLQEQINDFNKEELILANQKIEALTAELNDYDAQVRYLQQKLEKEEVTPVSLSYTTDEFNSLKEELTRYQNENQRLNNILQELNQSQTSKPSKGEYQSVIFNFPNQFQISLFIKMYDLLIELDKKKVIDALIKELGSKNVDVKRAVLKILGEIRDDKVYDAFLKLLHDEDWVIRYNVIKTLTKFGFENQVFRDLLQKLTKDIDIDVRELATKVLDDIS